ncbi:MAG: CPBP family intramembrane glutamic endopeptidase [Verrucomicrobiota bacterium]
MLKNDLAKIFFYFAGVLVLGAVLAPLIFNIGKSVVDFRILPEGNYLEKVLRESDFKRYFNRAVMIAAAILLWPLLKSLRLKKADMALGWGETPGRDWTQGFLFAGGLLLMMGVVYVFLGYFNKDFDLTAGKLLQIVAAALVVSLLEEVFFRGIMLGQAVKSFCNEWIALLVISAFFSAIHFLKPAGSVEIADEDVIWTTGFWILGQIFGQFSDIEFLLAEFLTLFAVGWACGIARLRTQSLWLSMGLHSGWIFGLKLYEDLTEKTKPLKRGEFMPWVGGDLKVGLVPLIVVVITGWIVLALWNRRRNRRLVADVSKPL